MESENPTEPEAQPAAPAAAPAEAPAAAAASPLSSLGVVSDVPLRVTVEVGSTKMLVRDVLQFAKGSVIDLDRASGEPADVLVNGRLLAKGEVTVEDDRLAVRIVEMLIDPPSS